jgi:hypothetical protein
MRIQCTKSKIINMSRTLAAAIAVIITMSGGPFTADAILYDDGACPLFALLPFTSMYVHKRGKTVESVT